MSFSNTHVVLCALCVFAVIFLNNPTLTPGATFFQNDYTLCMQAVLLAAGQSSRMWPVVEGVHKSLIVLMGKPLIQWTIESLQRIGVDDVIVVQSPDGAVKSALAGAGLSGVRYVEQANPNGMGDALLQAESLLDEQFLLLLPYRFDADELVPPLIQKQQATGCAAVLSYQPTDQPQHFGIITLDGDCVTELVEKPDNPQSNQRVMGIYYLSKKILEDYRSVKQHQYAFEDALQICIERDDVRGVEMSKPVTPLKHPWDLLGIADALFNREVTDVYIDPSAQIDDSAIIKGPAYIGPGVRIFENAVIKQAYLGPNCIIGTGSLVRERTILDVSVLIGAHAEVTRSVFGKGATTHSGFFGDSIFCPEAKAGAGTITANVRVDRKEIFSKVKDTRTATGLTSFGAVVGEHSHLGINTMLMPGVLIGSHALVGPGALAHGVIESNAKFFGREL
jgi:bifunctional UDP-N-acetylglucosamine pyrophosphorylase/glucosamine-1-phosphate N-acetyltransferase